MLSANARAEIARHLQARTYNGDQATNALLAAAFYLKDLTPITMHQTHQFEEGGKVWEECPGQLRGKTGWLSAPSYLSSIDDAADLVMSALGPGWIVETRIRADGSEAKLHQFDPPCARTGWHRDGPGKSGAATAIVKAVIEATEAKKE